MELQKSEATTSHALPSRKDRLKALMRLKSQRQALTFGIAALAILATALGGALWRDSNSTDVVRLGKGMASVDAQPVSNIEPGPISIVRTDMPTSKPSPTASALGAGEASYYGQELAGNRTANGETFDPAKLTAAHRTLPLGSRVKVTNPRNGESVVVRINDRGPYHGNRVIDLSTAAARNIGLIRSGTGRVNLALLIS